ncbi:pre-mRNA 3-end-processing factor fip1l1 [Phlyctochytrium planicorne]|nr:pre-mRNA 3-end-processing factor fip1l1 [Phlyctochytrium planicorne]
MDEDDELYGDHLGRDDNEDEEGSKSDDSDEDVEIVLDSFDKPSEEEEKPAALVNIKPQQQISKEEDSKAAAPTAKSTIDINAVGQYEGKDIYDADLDSFEDKPWRKPGADITDYFNYGFTETTWRQYIGKQKQIREEQKMSRMIHVHEFKPDDYHDGYMQSNDGGQGAKYQRIQQRNFNVHGKRPREQDDSVIQVLGNEYNEPRRDMGQKWIRDSKEWTITLHNHIITSKDYHGPPPMFNPEMGGPVPYEMFRRGNMPPMPMKGPPPRSSGAGTSRDRHDQPIPYPPPGSSRGFRDRPDERHYNDDKRSEDDRRGSDRRDSRDSRDSRKRGYDDKRR